MANRNFKIFDFFNQGKIKEAIIGSKNYFVPDVTYREQHDRLLIIRQLCVWAQENRKIGEASLSIEAVIDELYSMGKIFEILDVIWCFLLVHEESCCALTVDMDKVQDKLSTIVKKNNHLLMADNELRELVVSLSSKLPKFKFMLNL